MKQDTFKGLVEISDRVISSIIRYAVTETPGIAGMSGNPVSGNLARRLSGKIGTNGLSVDVTDEAVAIQLDIIINYGYKIPEVCQILKDNVHQAVEHMLGLSPPIVNIKVDKLAFPNL
ncbi:MULTISPECIES: Asp23/Gls24 family envelope stress response protein [Paenibacillus]|jgi:uncharacterized alkaline shock family protein YloU|uniref:Membrane protein n=3 Tax=Paenibacillus TaxID=44249 RepID=A0A089LCP3_PAEBO|nr:MULTISPECIES: Asp23/Gls24 family envelope stress response protein [Paenibacillus]AIQ58627.1 membrane protein [Paenibacillus borealis]AIQ41566.1 membrane protein [Paenibacillus sp. FSL R5-0912]KHL97635.1 membrane protein [Paenibacillus sp. IHB B 3415]NOU82160.1 Asp23/Gls24 family envelope stress response protein [Paenibacillus phytohabitans]OMF25126.1 hypothetical protein BK132_22905 [Paenibacillus sp. FSL H8-0259]